MFYEIYSNDMDKITLFFKSSENSILISLNVLFKHVHTCQVFGPYLSVFALEVCHKRGFVNMKQHMTG